MAFNRVGLVAAGVSVALHLIAGVVLATGRSNDRSVVAALEVTLVAAPILERPTPEPAKAAAPATPAGPAPSKRPDDAPRPVATPVASSAPPSPERPATAAAALLPVEPAPPPPPKIDTATSLYAQRVWSAVDRRRPRAVVGATAATVRFRINRKGALVSLRLARGSGRPDFDRAALAAVRSAAPFPPPPPEAAEADLAFEITIVSPR